MPIVKLGSRSQQLCHELLLRALELDSPLTDECFGPGLVPELLRTETLCAKSSLLSFTHNEPAVNVYTAGGDFSPHKDLQALTVLMPLTDATAYDGGGTAFWSAPSDAASGLGTVDDAGDPTLVLRPPAGTALIFGGDVTHAGLPVESGQRAVFVASFSRCCGGATGDAVEAVDAARRRENTMLEQLYT
eukprot:799626-Prymnesium_polylepis.1